MSTLMTAAMALGFVKYKKQDPLEGIKNIAKLADEENIKARNDLMASIDELVGLVDLNSPNKERNNGDG